MKRICKKHKLPVATADDLKHYERDKDRAECRRRGDCTCSICAAVCWDMACQKDAVAVRR